MQIIYWADYACPFCYIGETTLKLVLKQLGMDKEVQLDMKSFELEPDGPRHYEGPTAERNAKKYGYPVQEIKNNIEAVNQRGRQLGLDMHYDLSRYTNTFDAHRLTQLAKRKGDPERTAWLQERLFKAYFTDGLELADYRVLKEIASEAGLNVQEVQEMLYSDLFAEDVRQDECEAESYGVTAVPFFLIDRKYAIRGALPLEKMEAALKRASSNG